MKVLVLPGDIGSLGRIFGFIFQQFGRQISGSYGSNARIGFLATSLFLRNNWSSTLSFTYSGG